MTTVIAVKKPDGVLMGCDTQTTLGNYYNSHIDKKYTFNDRVAIAGAGLGTSRAWLSANIDSFPEIPHEAYVSTEAWNRFLSTDVVRWLKEFDGFKDSAFVVAIKNQIGLVEGTYVEVPFGNVIGTGSGWTKLGNYVIVNKVKTKKDVRKALEYAAATDNYTSPPFSIDHIKLRE